jgi:hypothetical protein
VQINQDLGVRPYELHQFRSDPEGAESFRHRDPDFAFERLSEAATAPEETLRRVFHSSGETKKFLAVFRKPDAIVVPCEQQDLELALQMLDALTDGLAGHPQSLCCGAKAARARDFEEHADVIPVWPGYLREFGCVLGFSSTVSRD